MRALAYLLNIVLLGALLIAFGWTLRTDSVDLVSHFSLVDEFMKYGAVRPEDKHLAWSMPMYPPLSHRAAAVLGNVVGSGLLAMSLLSIAAVYVCYFVIGLLLTLDGALFAIPLFLLLFGALIPTHALIGWEVKDNFFYPHLISVALCLSGLIYLALRNPRPAELAFCSVLFIPIIYLVQPFGGVYFSASALIFLATTILRDLMATRTVNVPLVLATLAICAATVVSLALPKVRALLSYSSNNGVLEFSFPDGRYLLAFGIFSAASVANYCISSWKTPGTLGDRILGAAGMAATALLSIQIAALDIFGSGSTYAVKKHGFMVVTIGTANLCRLISRALPRLSNRSWQPFAAGILALFATSAVFYGDGLDIARIDAARKFAADFVQTSGKFKPGNTTSYVSTLSPTVNELISNTSFNDDEEILYHLHGKLYEDARYVMVAGAREASCTLAANNSYSIVEKSCLRGFQPGVKLGFSPGDLGSIYLGQGWATSEPWGIWGLENPGLVVRLSERPVKLTAFAQAALSPQAPHLDFDVQVNGTLVATWSFDAASPSGERTADIPASAILADQDNQIKFVSRTPLISPKDAGTFDDTRKLGIGLHWIKMDFEQRSP